VRPWPGWYLFWLGIAGADWGAYHSLGLAAFSLLLAINMIVLYGTRRP